MPAAPKVFISYSHDSPAHKARVLALADRLRRKGIDAAIDQCHPSPPEGWPLWCEKQIEGAQWVIMVCTATYHRRVRNEEVSGTGLGVLHEAHIIRQELYEAGGVSAKFIPVYYSDGSRQDILRIVRRFSQYAIDTDQGFDDLYRLLTDQPATPAADLGPRDEMRPDPRRGLDGGAGSAPAPPPTQADRLFVGRTDALAGLTAVLLPAAGAPRRPVVVGGMPGVGKSYLVDRFYAEHRDSFPGGYVRISLEAAPPALEDLLAQVAGRLGLAAAGAASIAARLATPPVLLHVENVDGRQAGRLAGALAAALPGCALVFSARHRGLGTAAGWGQVRLEPFVAAEAVAQLRDELGAEAPDQNAWPELAAALGGLPLALHLAAGHLRAGDTPCAFLKRLRASGLALDYDDPADPVFQQRSRALLTETFESSVSLLFREGGGDGAAWVDGLRALGWGAAAGFGASLGAAIAGLEPEAFDEMARAAAGLSLVERQPGGSGLRLHPLLAELGRAHAPREQTVARMTGWFCARLPEPEAGEEWRWHEVHAETAALLEWLPLVPPAERMGVVRAGSRFAISTGPFHAWRRFCAAALADATDEEQRSGILWTLGNVALRGGDPDEALRRAGEKRDLDLARPDERGAALAASLIADILEARGDLDEALRIRREEELPVYQRLGDVRSRAVTMGQIADILSARGDLDEALRIRKEEELPVYERLGDVRLRAVTMGQIADILSARGELDEALRIRLEEELPVYERLGEVRARAVTMGKIADGLAQQGDLDEAIRLYQQEVLPSYVRLGDARMLVVDRGWFASHLLRRGTIEDCKEAGRLLGLALADARRLRIPEAGQIEAFLQQHGLRCP